MQMIYEIDEDDDSQRIRPIFSVDAGDWSTPACNSTFSLQRIGDGTAALIEAKFVQCEYGARCDMCSCNPSGAMYKYQFQTDKYVTRVVLCMVCADVFRTNKGFAISNNVLHISVDTNDNTMAMVVNMAATSVANAASTRMIAWSGEKTLHVRLRDRPLTTSSPSGGIFHVRADYSTIHLCDLLSEKPEYREIYCEERAPTISVSACMRDNVTCCVAMAKMTGRHAVIIDLRSGDCVSLDMGFRIPRWSSAAFISDNLCAILDIGASEVVVDIRAPGVAIYSVENIDGVQIA